MKEVEPPRLPDSSRIIELRKQDPIAAWEQIYGASRHLRLIIKGLLPASASIYDIEDCLMLFLSEAVPKIIVSFDPGKGSFEHYLQVCLRQFCWQEGKKIRARAHTEVSLTSEEGKQIESQIADTRPQNDIEGAVYREEVQVSLREEIEKLPKKYRESLLLSLKEMTDSEIAQTLGISLTNARVRLYRARKLLRECLKTRILTNEIKQIERELYIKRSLLAVSEETDSGVSTYKGLNSTKWRQAFSSCIEKIGELSSGGNSVEDVAAERQR